MANARTIIGSMIAIGVGAILVNWIFLGKPKPLSTSFSQKAEMTLAAFGFKEIKVNAVYPRGQTQMYGCSENETKATTLTATNSLGKKVDLIVCENERAIYGSATIRH